MSFQPIVPFGGIPGWKFLNKTLIGQQKAFSQSPIIRREVSVFQTKMQNITTAADIVKDYDVLKVVVGAFGLDQDINNKFFIKKIIEGGTIDPDALANRLTDPRYKRLAEVVGVGLVDSDANFKTDLVPEVIERYKELRFEANVGNQDEDMRLALNLKRELNVLVGENRTPDSKWFSIMGMPPVRMVFEVAFGLPKTFASLDIDQQLDIFRSRAESSIGISEINEFVDPIYSERLVEIFFSKKLMLNSPYLTGSSIALAILSK